MQFTATGTVETGDQSGLTLKTPLNVEKDGLNITVDTIDGSTFEFEVSGEAESAKEAKSQTRYILEDVLDYLVWEFNIPISSSSIDSIQSNNGDVTVFTETLGLEASFTITQSVPEEKCHRISEDIESGLSNRAQEMLFMYREAVSCDSIHLRYLLLWRLMEKVFGNASDTDDWIKQYDSGVETHTDNHGNTSTVYRYLRDNLHPRSDEFPFDEIERRSKALQSMTRKAIKQKVINGTD